MEILKEEFNVFANLAAHGTTANEIDILRDAVALAVECGWLSPTAACRASLLLADGFPFEAAQLLVPAGWSVAVAVVDPEDGPGDDTPYTQDIDALRFALDGYQYEVAYVARSTPDPHPTDWMAINFGPEDACHFPSHGFLTPALAVGAEAMMLQSNIELLRSSEAQTRDC